MKRQINHGGDKDVHISFQYVCLSSLRGQCLYRPERSASLSTPCFEMYPEQSAQEQLQ
jgi:hypothetical protein